MNSANKDYFHDLLTQPNERVGERIPAAEVSYTPGGFLTSSTVQEALDAAAASIVAGGGGSGGGFTIPGEDGMPGESWMIPGPVGPAGGKGADGTQGVQGPMGFAGFDGIDGEGWMIPGPVGPQGATGGKGVDGIDGAQGPRGFPGEDGYPAEAELIFIQPPNILVSNAMSVVVLGGDITNNNAVANTIADVTGLSFPVIAGQTYWFEFIIPYTSAATTTGSRWSINGPAAPTMLAYRSEYTLTATSLTNNSASAYDTPAASNASSLTAGNIATIWGIIKPSANGTVIARFASEVSSSAVIAKAGATCRWLRVL